MRDSEGKSGWSTLFGGISICMYISTTVHRWTDGALQSSETRLLSRSLWPVCRHRLQYNCWCYALILLRWGLFQIDVLEHEITFSQGSCYGEVEITVYASRARAYATHHCLCCCSKKTRIRTQGKRFSKLLLFWSKRYHTRAQ